jgi:hypothetical protein
MLINQISVFLGNTPGRLATVAEVLAENNIDIRALCIADTTDFGILRIIVDNTDLAFQKLKENSFAVNITNVITVSMSDKPGSMANCLAVLKDAGVAIEYLYAFTGRKKECAFIVIKADNNEKAIEALKNNGISVIESLEEI